MATRPSHDAAAPPAWVHLTELASSKVGGKMLFSTDEWFSEASNMVRYEEPEWREDEFTEQGKWMDGWESRRKRIPGHDWCILRLGIPGVIRGIVVDTAYFSGNFVPKVSIHAGCDANEGALAPYDSIRGQAATQGQINAAEKITCGLTKKASADWTPLVPMKALDAGYQDTRYTYFTINSEQRWTHLRVNMFPDGGIARIRVHGDVVLPATAMVAGATAIDLCAVENGAKPLGWSNTHYGHPRNLLNPGVGVNMGDGWETARRLDRPAILLPDEKGHLKVPGNEWCVLKLGVPGKVQKVVVSTTHFKGNFPESCKVEACAARASSAGGSLGADQIGLDGDECEALGEWFDLVPRVKLTADADHTFAPSSSARTITHVRLTMYPDGGISRLRLLGNPDMGRSAKL
eukprot:gene6093-9232_t